MTVNAVPPLSTTASLSAASFNFGNNLVNNTLSQSVVTVTNTGASALALSPTISGDAGYTIVSTGSCGAQLAPAASCPMMVSYTPSTASAPSTQNAVLEPWVWRRACRNSPDGRLVRKFGRIACRTGDRNQQPPGGALHDDAALSRHHDRELRKRHELRDKTWAQSTTESGGQVSIFVAGMQGSSTYHMQAAVQFTNGISATDGDHMFTTQAVPANMRPNLTVTTAAGMTPQPGIELLDVLGGSPSGVVVTDLAGNILWTYAVPGVATNSVQGVKLLPNGDFLHGNWSQFDGPAQQYSGWDDQRDSGSKPGRRHRPRDHPQRPECTSSQRRRMR